MTLRLRATDLRSQRSSLFIDKSSRAEWGRTSLQARLLRCNPGPQSISRRADDLDHEGGTVGAIN